MSLNINDILIIETNFKVIGKPSSTKTRFKGIITPESIFGGETYHINKSYFDYTSRIDAKDEIELNNNHLINIKDDSDYFGYTSRLIDKGNFTFTNNGFLKT